MQQMIKLLEAEFKMFIGELKSYSVNYIFHNLNLVFLFLGIFLSFNYNNKLDSATLLLSLLGWNIANAMLSQLPYVIQDESSLGTLEQIFMTRTSIYKLLSAKMIVFISYNLVRGFILFIICGKLLSVLYVYNILSFINIVIILFLFVVLSITFNFMGLIFAGLALFFKRVSSIVNVFSYVLLFFSGATISSNKIPVIVNLVFNIIPLKWFKLLIEGILKNGEKSIFISNYFLYFILSSGFWSILGIIIFKISLIKAKENGKLGHY